MNQTRFLLVLGLAASGLLGSTPILRAQSNVVFVENGCAEGCSHKVCRPTVETKKIAKRVYDDTCEDFCLPKCSMLGGLLGHKSCGGECDSCDAGTRCGHPRTRKYLVVKVRHEDQCVNKCVVTHENCPPAGACNVSAPALPPQSIKVAAPGEYQPLPIPPNK